MSKNKKKPRKPAPKGVIKKPGKISSIKTLGQTWQVRYCEEFVGDEELQGLCINDRREILIKNDIALDAQLDTLLHEIWHGYQEINRMPIGALPEDPEELMEYFAQYHSAMMIDLIRNNPTLIKAILESGE